MHHDSPRNVSSKKQEFHSNQVWARWDYSPEEWALFDRVDWQAARLRYWLPNLIVLVCFFCLLFLSVFVFHLAVLGPVLGMIVFVLPVAVVPFLARSYVLREAKKRHNARQNRDQPQRVTFSQTGVWEAGTHFPFLRLRGVRMTSQPAVLHFHRRKTDHDTDNTFYQYDTLRVLVPRGHEEEATRLMERFRARITELNNWTPSSPPEPV